MFRLRTDNQPKAKARGRLDVSAAASRREAAKEFYRAMHGNIAGEVLVSSLDRGIYSTDAGNYRIPPAAIVRPKSIEDIEATIETAFDLNIPITARGAGTSCAGNAIGPGVVIDYSRHFNKVLDIDPETRTALVEAGAIQGTLQKAAAPHGLRFGPDPSTWNRCTIGGMIGNNACGPHATAYGRTADNVRSLRFIDGLRRRIDTEVDDITAIPGLRELVDDNLALIRTTFGRFNRQVSGYSLEHLLPENHGDLAKFFVGTEGTLGIVTHANVRLVPLPEAPVLVALGFANMTEAADAVPTVLRHHPLAVEGMDARLVDVVRQHKGPGAVPDLPRGEGWLMCEVGGEGMSEQDALAAARTMAADVGLAPESVMIYPPGAEAAALWRIRADGAGLGGRTPVVTDAEGNVSGGEQGWPGWEDAAVPPEQLGDYLRDFDVLMKDYNIDGLIYGHFGDGCVHVRLDLPLGSAAGVGKSRKFLEDAADLIGRYQGSISGEHGDGRARSELLTRMYPREAVGLFAKVKTLFDPDDRMNPGVITRPWEDHFGHVDQAAPDALDENMRRPSAKQYPADKHGFSFETDHGDLTTAVHRCTGVAKCRANNAAAGGFMCPSFQASHEDKDSTRGRARILQEATNGTLVKGLAAPEVMEVLDLCLACKACATDCPAGIDMAKYRSEIYSRAYQGRLRPRTHYFLGWLPMLLRFATAIPGVPSLANAVMSISPIRKIAFKLTGIDTRRLMPKLSAVNLDRWAEKRRNGERDISELRRGFVGEQVDDDAGPSGDRDVQSRGESGVKLHADAAHSTQADAVPEAEDLLEKLMSKHRFVMLWADSFSHCLEPAGAKASVELLERLGYTVLMPKSDICCGLTWITTGQLSVAQKKLAHAVERLSPVAQAGIPIVGVEPSCTAVLRDDLRELLPDDPKAAAVSGAVRTLAEFLAEEKSFTHAYLQPDLTNIEIVAQPHCHHYSVMGWSADRKLLESCGAKVTELAGCCGLAGNFGMEKGHYDMSVAVAKNQLLPALREHPDAIYLADGFSCRTQAEQLAGRNGIHLAQLLLQHLP